MNEAVKSKGLVNGSIIVIGFAVLVMLLIQFESFLKPFAIALLLSFVFIPVIRKFEEKRLLAWTISAFVVILVIIGGFFLYSIIKDQLADFDMDTLSNLPEKLSQKTGNIGIRMGDRIVPLSEILRDESIQSFFQSIFAGVIGAVRASFSALVLIFLFMLFILPSYDTVFGKSNKIKKLMKRAESTTRTYFIIKFNMSLLTGLVTGIVLFAFGVKGYVLFGLMTFMLNFIPNIGSFIAVAVVLAFRLARVGFSGQFVVLALILVLIQFLIGSVLETKISSKTMKISPIIVLMGLFFWGSIWGIAGMFFSVPLTMLSLTLLQDFMKEK